MDLNELKLIRDYAGAFKVYPYFLFIVVHRRGTLRESKCEYSRNTLGFECNLHLLHPYVYAFLTQETQIPLFYCPLVFLMNPLKFMYQMKKDKHRRNK